MKVTINNTESISASTLASGAGSFWSKFAQSNQFYNAVLKAQELFSFHIFENLVKASKTIGYKSSGSSYIFFRYLLALTPGTYNPESGNWEYDLNSNILSAELLANSFDFDNASRVLPSTQFRITNGKLYLTFDVFQNDNFNKIKLFNQNYCYVWAKNVEILDDSPYYNFGSLLNLPYGTGADYKALVRALWNCYLARNLKKSLFVIKAIQYNVPVSRYDREEVISITSNSNRYIVTTNKDVYYIPNEFELIVNVGTKLSWGDPLVKNCFISDFHDRTVDSRISYIRIPTLLLSSFLSYIDICLLENNNYLLLEDNKSYLTLEDSGFPLGGIEWKNVIKIPNTEVAVTQYEDENGIIRVSFQLAGHPDDIEEFWRCVRAREDIQQKTLYSYLTELYGSVPETINPASFFASQLLFGCCYIISFPAFVYSNSTNDILSSLFPGILILEGES